jgi:hypothetical protein
MSGPSPVNLSKAQNAAMNAFRVLVQKILNKNAAPNALHTATNTAVVAIRAYQKIKNVRVPNAPVTADGSSAKNAIAVAVSNMANAKPRQTARNILVAAFKFARNYPKRRKARANAKAAANAKAKAVANAKAKAAANAKTKAAANANAAALAQARASAETARAISNARANDYIKKMYVLTGFNLLGRPKMTNNAIINKLEPMNSKITKANLNAALSRLAPTERNRNKRKARLVPLINAVLDPAMWRSKKAANIAKKEFENSYQQYIKVKNYAKPESIEVLRSRMSNARNKLDEKNRTAYNKKLKIVNDLAKFRARMNNTTVQKNANLVKLWQSGTLTNEQISTLLEKLNKLPGP